MTDAKATQPGATTLNNGIALVFAAAVAWSFGGAIARFLTVTDSWTIVFWRAGFASAFLLAVMLWREGWGGTRGLIFAMRLPAFAVALCFATASSSFVIALAHTSVANILLMQAGAPLIAALIGGVLFGEAVSLTTWAAITAVIAGVAIMVSGTLSGQISPVGDSLALLIAVLFSVAIVLTRRFAQVSMIPAVWLGTLVSSCFAATMAGHFAVSATDLGVLFVFGALSFALGLSLFVSGVRLIPATIAALISVAEPVLAPVWVWLIHNEIPAPRTLIGGGIVVAALLLHVGWQLTQRQGGR